MKRIIAILCTALMLPVALAAQDEQKPTDRYAEWGPKNLNKAGWIFRVGYVIGGTSPLPLPKEIRSINGFKPLGGFTLGIDYYQLFTRRVGVQAGVHFFHEGFHTSANVKNYHMAITQGGNTLSGNFTGTDVTNTTMTGITLPVTASFRVSPRWNIGAGPFFTFLGNATFEGEVYDNDEGIGYLREGDPTGKKVEITRENPATYDFGPDMRHFYWGVEFMFEWKATQHLNLFGAFDWSFNSIFPASFETIPFAMYPLYAKLGLAYRL